MYSNIRIIANEYYIFEYEYSIFLFWIYSIFVLDQVAKNEYIRYSYLVLLQTTNIFDIHIRSAVRIWIYSIFVFGKIFHKCVLIYRQAAKIIGNLHKYAPKLIQNLLFGGGVSSKVCILYIQYSYSSMFLWMNIFDICIWSGT